MQITILDGGMGQELVARSPAVATPLWSATIMREHPDLVFDVHLAYFRAGAEIATTNSYILHRDRLNEHGAGDHFKSLNLLACELANRARDQHGSGKIAGGLGPTGRSYRPDLALSVEQAADVYAELALIQAPLVDFFLLETMASVQQAKGAVLGAKTAGKPVWLAVTVDDENGSVLRSQEPVSDIVALSRELKVDALLINCSTPEAVTAAMPSLSGMAIPFGAYANGFTKITDSFKQRGATVDALTARKDLLPDDYADFAQQWINLGASIIGGCCEVGPDHIRELALRYAAG